MDSSKMDMNVYTTDTLFSIRTRKYVYLLGNILEFYIKYLKFYIRYIIDSNFPMFELTMSGFSLN